MKVSLLSSAPLWRALKMAHTSRKRVGVVLLNFYTVEKFMSEPSHAGIN